MNNQKSWLRLQVVCNSEAMASIENRLFELGALGTHELDDRIEGYFSSDFDPSLIQKELENYAREIRELGFLVDDILADDVPWQNWNEAWQDYFQPVQISDRLLVKPPWIELDENPEKIFIDIQPKMAFGTGTHETTQLCLQFLENYIQSGMTVLDIGTGSGILSIAAVKLGASTALGVDIEEESIENANENSLLNKTNKQTRFLLGSLDVIPNQKFDLILANLNCHVLSELLSQIIQYGNNESILILSGILEEEEDKILKSIEPLSCQIIKKQVMGEWLALAIQITGD